jgi:serine/threonine protein kinase
MDAISDQARSQLFTIKIDALSATPVSDVGAAKLLAFDSVIDNKYRVVELLGKGGMGAVYVVHHLQLGKDMALKTFLTDQLSQSAWVRFQGEAQAIARLDHPNVVKVFDFGVDSTDGRELPFYTMELLRGKSLCDLLAESGRLELMEALNLFIQVSHGLAAVHGKSIVHGDIKPANIFLETPAATGPKQPRPKLVDFGIASLAVVRPDNDDQYESGEVFGSPLYMSPEQITGKKLTPASDIYSFGCTFYEAITGRPPFHGATAFATMTMHLNQQPSRLSDELSEVQVPQRLEGLLTQMLAKNPDRRPQSFDVVADELSGVMRQATVIKNQSKTFSAMKASAGIGEKPHHAADETEVDKAVDDSFDANKGALARSRSGLRNLVSYLIISFSLLAICGAACLVYKDRLFAQIARGAPKINNEVLNPSADTSDGGNMFQFPAVDKIVQDKLAVPSLNPPPEIKVQALKIDPGSFDRTTEEQKAKGLRHFEFPKDEAIGVFDRSNENKSGVDAQGPVTVSPDCIFYSNELICTHPEYLQGFKADSLFKFSQIDNSNFGDRHVEYLARLTSLHFLQIRGAKILKESSLSQLKNLKLLDNFQMEGSSAPAGALCKIDRLKYVSVLNVAGSKFGGAVIGHFGGFPNMTSLYATHCGLKNEDLEALGSCPSLRELWLNNNPAITDEGLPPLLKLKLVTRLELRGTRVTAKSIPLLASMKSLRKIVVDTELWKDTEMEELRSRVPRGCTVDTK